MANVKHFTTVTHAMKCEGKHTANRLCATTNSMIKNNQRTFSSFSFCSTSNIFQLFYLVSLFTVGFVVDDYGVTV